MAGDDGLSRLNLRDQVPQGLTPCKLKQLLYFILMARTLDERVWLLNRQGKVPFVLSCQGHEGISAAAGMALNPSVDWIAPYYRDLAMVLTFGMTPEEVMLAFFAKEADPNSGGRQMPAHYGSLNRHILTGSSPVATQVAHAAGVAWAAKIQKESAVALVSVGEGSTNQGEFHEALNFAAVHKIPLIVLVQNNGFAISTPLSRQVAIHDISVRAIAYGVPGVTVEGTDPLAVYEAVRSAREYAVSGQGPILIEAKTYRLTPHSSDDDDRGYKSKTLRLKERERDVVPLFVHWLKNQGYLDDEEEIRMKESIQSEVDAAIVAAEQAPFPEPSTLYTHVVGDGGDTVQA